MGHTVCEDAPLAAAGTRKNKNGALCFGGRGSLLVVERGKGIHQSCNFGTNAAAASAARCDDGRLWRSYAASFNSVGSASIVRRSLPRTIYYTICVAIGWRA